MTKHYRLLPIALALTTATAMADGLDTFEKNKPFVEYLGKRIQKSYLSCPEIAGELRDTAILPLAPQDKALVDKMFPSIALKGNETFGSKPAEMRLANGTFNVSWGGMKGETHQLRDTAGDFLATIPSVRIYDKDVSVKLSDIRYQINSECDAGMPARMYAKITAKDMAAQLKVGPIKKLLLKGMEIESSAQQTGQLVDLKMNLGLNSVEVEQYKVGPIELGFSANHLNVATMKRFVEASNRLSAQTDLSPEERIEKTREMMPILLELVEDEPSVSFDKLRIQALDKGLTLDGRISLSHIEKADTEEPARFLKKLDGELHLTLTRPALKRAVDMVVTEMQKSKKDNPFKGIKPAEAKKMAYNMAEAKLKEFAKGNFVKLDDDKITADLTFKEGKLTVNGKEIPLPPFGAPKEEAADSTAQ